MHITDELCRLLICPQSGGPIANKDGRYYSPNADIKYDNYEGIPWLFKHPKIHLYQWQQHIKNFLVSIEENLEFIDNQTLLSLGTNKTKQRLLNIRAGLRHNSETLMDVLKAFIEQAEADKPNYKELNFDRLPPNQHLNSYFHTLFRDWAWKNNESSQALSLLSNLFKDQAPDKLLVLGSGASRLAFDLHNDFVRSTTVALDINPLLLMTAKRVIFDDGVEFFELPIAPLHFDDASIKQSLQRPRSVKPGFNLVFADGLNPPFKKESFEAVLTPWFIDIVPIDFGLLARKINHLLPMGGRWYNFGPLGYESHLKAQSYSFEEILELLEQNGFKAAQHTEHEIEYLASPHSSQARKEKIITFSCEKTQEAGETPYFNYFPPWIVNDNAPIPRLPNLDHVQIQNKTYSELINCIDGTRTINDIVPLMIKHYGMEEEIAREALTSVLINIFEGRV